jgi:hypothetical protein
VTLYLHHDALSAPAENPRLRILNLGAGVQSSTMLWMAERGEFGPKPDFAIFADTQSEPRVVYEHLEYLRSTTSIPIIVTTKGSLREQMREAAAGRRAAHDRPPLFVWNPQTGRRGFTKRQCTRDYKILPIRAKVRELLGMKKGQSVRNFLGLKRGEPVPVLVEQWVGISTDEIERLKRSTDDWIYLRHPLIEARMDRRACVKWAEERQYRRAPKSACTFCTYRDNAGWAHMQETAPDEFEDACQVDDGLRAAGRHKNMREEMFLHPTLKPLREVDFSKPDLAGFDFRNECEGMCGV